MASALSDLAHRSHKAPRPWLANCSAEKARYSFAPDTPTISPRRSFTRTRVGYTTLLRAPETRRFHRAMLIRLTALPFLIAVQVTPVADLQNPSVSRGYTLVEAACAACHAVGRFDASPLKSAPPLRDVHKRYPIEDLAEALAEGLITGHPSKPELRFDARDVADIIDYLKSLEQ
jgi:cytochrome c